MRPIDADRLYNTIIDEVDPISISMDGGAIRGIMRTIIAAEPTIDAIPVIRCADCRHLHMINAPDGQRWNYCPFMKFDVKPDFYCANAERRTNDPT